MKMIKKYKYLLIVAISMALYASCSKEDSSEKFPPNDASSCTDGILNQGEFRTDCGGPCDSCLLNPVMTAVIDTFWIDDTLLGTDGFWQANVITAFDFSNGLEIRGVDTNSGRYVEFSHNQAYRRGVFTYQDIEGESHGCSLTDGIVEFTAFDTIQQTVSGHFSFNCVGFISGKKERILEGKFEDIKYF